MKNELFNYLSRIGVFKGNPITHRASKKTEQRRFERNRGQLIWISIDMSRNPETGLIRNKGKGTYIRKLHGRLKWRPEHSNILNN